MVALSSEDKKKLIAASVARAKQKQERQSERFVDFLARVRIQDAAANPPRETPFELWPYLVERAEAWHGGDSEIVLKARQMGFSWLGAAYTAYVARQRYARVLIISQGEREAWEFLDKVKYICRATGIGLAKNNAGYIAVQGGGEVRALPSTEDAGRGYTATLVFVDEAAYHPWAEENARAYLPTVADGGQVIICSTSAGASGWFYDMYNRAEVASLTPVFVPWFARPGRDEEWEKVQRGRYTREAFRREYPSTVEDAFEMAKGLVYGAAFSREENIRATPIPWEECLYRYAAYDLGGGDPTALVIAGLYRDLQGQPHLHVYDIGYWDDGAPSVDMLYASMAPWHDTAPFSEIAGDPVPGGETIRNSLGAMGLPVRRANNNRGVGIDVVRLMMEKNWLTVDASVGEGVAEEVRSYRWRSRTDQHSKEKYLTDTPQDHHADRLDAIRYLCMLAWVDAWNNMDGQNKHVAYTAIRW